MQLSQMNDEQLFAAIHDPVAEDSDDKTCILAERELGDRLLHRYASRLTSLDAHPTIQQFVKVLTTSTYKDCAVRLEAANDIPSFHLLQQCYYTVSHAISSACENEIERYATAVLEFEMGQVFEGIHGWQN